MTTTEYDTHTAHLRTVFEKGHQETQEQCAQGHADNRTERMEAAYAALNNLQADECDAVITAYRRGNLQPIRTWVAGYYKRLLAQIKAA